MQAASFGLFPPDVQRVAHFGAARLDGEIDQGGGAAEGRRAGAGFEIVARRCSAEWHVEMRVRVDAAGKQYIPVASSTAFAGLGGNAPAHFFDDAAVNQYVRGDSLGPIQPCRS